MKNLSIISTFCILAGLGASLPGVAQSEIDPRRIDPGLLGEREIERRLIESAAGTNEHDGEGGESAVRSGLNLVYLIMKFKNYDGSETLDVYPNDNQTYRIKSCRYERHYLVKPSGSYSQNISVQEGKEEVAYILPVRPDPSYLGRGKCVEDPKDFNDAEAKSIFRRKTEDLARELEGQATQNARVLKHFSDSYELLFPSSRKISIMDYMSDLQPQAKGIFRYLLKMSVGSRSSEKVKLAVFQKYDKYEYPFKTKAAEIVKDVDWQKLQYLMDFANSLVKSDDWADLTPEQRDQFKDDLRHQKKSGEQFLILFAEYSELIRLAEMGGKYVKGHPVYEQARKELNEIMDLYDYWEVLGSVNGYQFGPTLIEELEDLIREFDLSKDQTTSIP